jgi:hypothetical protein
MAFFGGLFALYATLNAYTVQADRARIGAPLPLWQPMVWELSSNLLLWLLIPALYRWLERFPLSRARLPTSLPAHLLATGPFSLVHVEGMILLRKLAYGWVGDHYDFGPFLDNWLYEFRKDFVTYATLVVALHVMRRFGSWQAARERQEPGDGLPPTPLSLEPAVTLPEAATLRTRLLVRKRNREFILDADDIDHLQADGNYVVVHAGRESYRLRDSLDGLARRLGEGRFARVHRAHVVNIDRILEIQPWDHGDYRIVLKDGRFVNFSRRYRSRLNHLFR